MSRKGESPSPAPAPISEEQVLAFLKAHPDILARHPELAIKLAPPSRFDGDGVVDLQHYMIERLHDELDQMRGCAEHLITTSRSNMSIQTRTHEAALAILGATGLDALVRAVGDDLPTILDVDIAALCLESGEGPHFLSSGLKALPAGLLEEIMGPAEVLLKGVSTGDPRIFGDGSGLVASFALARVTAGDLPAGLLALGSRQERSFHSSQGTELLSFLARVLAVAIERWWPAA